MAIRGQFPSIRPSLDLNFAKTKKLDPRITFTRASSGTYVGSDGLIKTAAANEARFDHSPSTLESLGLLVEEQGTNLALRSEEFDNAFWTKTNATITTDNIASPAGPVTADKLVETSDTGVHRVFNNTLSILASTTYTLSVYAKAGERSRLQLDMRDSIGVISAATFNLANGTFTSNTGTAHTITALQNGWYRLAVSATTSVSHASVGTFVLAMSDGTSTSYTGDNTSGIYLWGAQLEAGAFPTSYIPTTTASVTRSTDVASITGANFSSWYRQDEGTVFAEGRPANGGVVTVADDGSFSNRKPQINLGSAGSADIAYITAGAVVASFDLASSASVMNRWATAYATDNFGFAANGSAPTQDSSGALPSGNNALRVGSFHSGASCANGPIRRITYWPWRLSNATLQALTS